MAKSHPLAQAEKSIFPTLYTLSISFPVPL